MFFFTPWSGLKVSPPKIHTHLEPRNMTFRSRVLVDAIKVRLMWDCTGLGWTLNTVNVSLPEEKIRETQRRRPMQKEADSGDVAPSQRPPRLREAARSQGGAGRTSPQACRPSMGLPIPRHHTSDLQNSEKTDFSHFKPPSLWLLCYSSPRELTDPGIFFLFLNQITNKNWYEGIINNKLVKVSVKLLYM